MTGTFEVIDDEIKIAFAYQAEADKVTDIVGDAAHYLWKEEMDENGEVINPFDEATNQEKLDVVDAHLKRVIIDAANTFKSLDAQRVAREEVDKHEF